MRRTTHSGPVSFLGFSGEGLGNQVVDHARERGHFLREFFRCTDSLDFRLKEPGKELRGLRDSLRVRLHHTVLLYVGDSRARNRLAVTEITKFEAIGQDEVAQARAVALELLIVFDLIERLAYVFCLDVTDRDGIFGNDKIGRAASFPFGLVRGSDAGSK